MSMSKYNNNGKNSESVCEKIRNAKLNPFTGKFRSAKIPLRTKNPISVEIPIESSTPQLLPARMKNNGDVIEVATVDPKNEPYYTRGHLKGQQLVKANTSKSIHDNGEEDINGKSGSYIDRVKNKMRAKSSIGVDLGKRDSFNDKVSGYINRAKIKLRTTSSINGGK